MLQREEREVVAAKRYCFSQTLSLQQTKSKPWFKERSLLLVFFFCSCFKKQRWREEKLHTLPRWKQSSNGTCFLNFADEQSFWNALSYAHNLKFFHFIVVPSCIRVFWADTKVDGFREFTKMHFLWSFILGVLTNMLF